MPLRHNLALLESPVLLRRSPGFLVTKVEAVVQVSVAAQSL